jgi:environmental stress-induced protein Ves
MDIHRFSRDGLPVTPWKNGGGATREIACWPPGAGLDDFDWRASIATIAASGPFSVFAGVDRTIMLLDGGGVLLRTRGEGAGAGFEHRLDRPHASFAFSGDTAMDCTLLPLPPATDEARDAPETPDAPVSASAVSSSSDFNVMTRRGRCSADVRVLHEPQSLAGAAHGLLMNLGNFGDGTWRLEALPDGQADTPIELRPGDGLWWAGTPMAWRLAPVDSGRGIDGGQTGGLVAVRWTFSTSTSDSLAFQP